MRHAPLTLRGTLASGLGRGATFMAIDWVRDGLARIAGFLPYPGTLNVALLAEDVATWRQLLGRSGTTLAPPSPDTCGARVVRAVIVPDVPAAIVVPDITAHPDHVIEVVAPTHVRTQLGVADGDMLTLTIVD